MLTVPAIHRSLCYVRRLIYRSKRPLHLGTILSSVCHEISSSFTFVIPLTLLWSQVLAAQVAPPPEVIPSPAPPPGALNGVIRPEAPPTGYWDLYALHKEAEGALFKLRGNARVQGANMAFQADEIDWNGETHDLEARGNVYYQNFDRNERIWCDSLKYNT